MPTTKRTLAERSWRWLWRQWHTPMAHGFGIQSPTDYHFVTVVLRRQLPKAVQALLPADAAAATVCRLAYVVAEEQAPRTVAIIGEREHLVKVLRSIGNAPQIVDIAAPSSPQMVVADANALLANEQRAAQIVAALPPDGIFLLANKHAAAAHQHLWETLSHLPTAVLVYDLYDHGIIIAATRRYPHRYPLPFP